MSYNVTMWKTKELVDLKIPVASLYKHPRKEWHPRQYDGIFTIAEGTEIRGTIEDGILTVSSITAYGEGSGTALNMIIEPALEDSTGRLVAVRIWEGGDTIDRLIVQDGVLTHEEIQL